MPSKNQEIEINISELILTPFTEASIVNEILKGVLYQKCQIPFPYNWLKSVVEKRRKKNESAAELPLKINFTHENHFRIVSGVFDALESIMKGITKEFCECKNLVKEILIVFGSTPSCPKELFTIVLPPTIQGHTERNHIGQLNKHLQKVLRKIFLSQNWMDSVDGSTTCMNIFFYLKKLVTVENDLANEEFLPCAAFHIAPNVKQTSITIKYDLTERPNCCDNLSIFDESENSQQNLKAASSNMSSEEKVAWYRSKHSLKGFKDCFINKISVCELW